MTATVAEQADLHSLTEDALAEMYSTADDDTQAAILAECARRDRADKARDKRRAVEAEWYDAAFAQYLAAEAECRGNLLSRFGEAEGITEPMSLWRGSEAWAMRRASEELQELSAANGGRSTSLAAVAGWPWQPAGPRRTRPWERRGTPTPSPAQARAQVGAHRDQRRAPGHVPTRAHSPARMGSDERTGTITVNPQGPRRGVPSAAARARADADMSAMTPGEFSRLLTHQANCRVSGTRFSGSARPWQAGTEIDDGRLVTGRRSDFDSRRAHAARYAPLRTPQRGRTGFSSCLRQRSPPVPRPSRWTAG